MEKVPGKYEDEEIHKGTLILNIYEIQLERELFISYYTYNLEQSNQFACYQFLWGYANNQRQSNKFSEIQSRRVEFAY